MESIKSYELKKAEYRDKSLEYYTQSEEVWNSISHFVGGILGLIGFIYLIVIANTPSRIVAAIITGIGGTVPYFISAVYHFIKDPQKKLIARKIDYCGVSFIIVACGAPLALGIRVNPINVVSVAICFAVAFVIIFLSVYDVKRFSKHVLILDLIIAAVLLAVYLYNRELIALVSKVWYIIGALFCLAGLFFFGKKKQYLHTCFHILMVMGTASIMLAGIYIFLN